MNRNKFLTRFTFPFKWLWNVFKEAVEHFLGNDRSGTERPPTSRWGGRFLLKWCLILTIPSICGYFGYSIKQIFEDWKEERKVHQMQDVIKSIEEKFAELKTYPTFFDNWVENEIIYRDKITGEQIAIDVREEGRLRFRKYYRQGRLVARDIFHYQYIKPAGDIKPAGKTREYMEGSVVVLTDEFTPAGALKSKRHSVKGDDKNCRNYLRDFRSPLPPSAFVIYR